MLDVIVLLGRAVQLNAKHAAERSVITSSIVTPVRAC
jgi:hypothetical protein